MIAWLLEILFLLLFIIINIVINIYFFNIVKSYSHYYLFIHSLRLSYAHEKHKPKFEFVQKQLW